MNATNTAAELTAKLQSCRLEYDEYAFELQKICNDAALQNDPELVDVANLLNNICFLQINNDIKEKPFQERVYSNIQAIGYNSLSKAEINVLDELLDTSITFLLKARIADILWLVKGEKKQRHEYAKIAITEYQKFNIDYENIGTNHDYYIRAIRLCKELGKAGTQELSKLQSIILDKFGTVVYSESTPTHLIFLSKILLDEKVADASKIIQKLETFADDFTSCKQYYYARLYFEHANMFTKPESDEQNTIYSKIARSLLDESTDKDREKQFFHAATLMSRAIDTYRCIKNNERVKYISKDDFYDLFKQREVLFGKGECDYETLVFTVPLADKDKNFKTLISDLTKEDTIKMLASITRLANVEELEDSIKRIRNSGLLSHMLVSQHVLFNGKVAKIVPPCDFDDQESDNTRRWELHQKVTNNAVAIGYKVQQDILPMLQLLNLEYLVSFDDVFQLCKKCPIIPDDRKIVWAKGLWNGFHLDFITSIHLLIPLLEDFIRQLFVLNKERTTVTDTKTGLENEKALTFLLECEGARKFLGDPVYWDIYTLLGGNGMNLRSMIAHGLLSDNDLHNMTVYFAYLWWICLHLVTFGDIDSKYDTAIERV